MPSYGGCDAGLIPMLPSDRGRRSTRSRRWKESELTAYLVSADVTYQRRHAGWGFIGARFSASCASIRVNDEARPDSQPNSVYRPPIPVSDCMSAGAPFDWLQNGAANDRW